MKQRLVPFTKDGVRWEHFYVDPKSGILYYSRKFNGKRFKFSTHHDIDEPLKAKRYANLEFERRIGKRKVFKKTLIMDELDAWLKVKEAENLSLSTMYNIKQGHKDLKAYWGEMYPDEITRDTLPDWYAWFKKERGISLENNIKCLRMFAKYLHQKVIDGRPLLPAIPSIKDPDQKKRDISRAEKKERIFTHDEFKKVLDSARSADEALIAHIMYTMATRIDETLKLDFTRTILLDEEVPCYRWHKGQNKMSLEGVHALHPSLIAPLEALRQERTIEGTDLLFPQATNRQAALKHQLVDWAEWRKRADLGWHWTPHTFRHTCLTNLFNDESLNQLLVCKLYRVSMKVAMKTYIKVQMSSILKLQNAVKVDL